MFLKVFNYYEFENTPKAWGIRGLELGPVNLLVAKNASGKTKTLTVLYALARMLAGEVKPTFNSGNYHAVFDNTGQTLEYVFGYENGIVIHEIFMINKKVLLSRDRDGIGTVFAEKISDDGMMIDFQAPETELAAVARRDKIQHPYLEPLSEWGKATRNNNLSNYLRGRMV